MSSGDEDEWEDSWANELLEEMHSDPPPASTAPKIAKPPRKASGDDRKLDWCTDKTPDRVLKALENKELYKDVSTFTSLMNFMFNKSNDGFNIWEHLKPYHANLLAYQVALGIQASTLQDVKMIRACYNIIVRVLEDSVRSVGSHSLYIQWVGRETHDEFTNITIIYNFLREHDEEMKATAGPGKLP